LNDSAPLEIRKVNFPSDADYEILCTFGGASGLWYWNYTGSYPGVWIQLTSNTPDWDGGFCESYDPDNDSWEEVAVDFGSFGLWQYEHTGGSWLKLNSNNPQFMVRADYYGDGNDTSLIIDFGPGVGLWLYNGLSPSWIKLSSFSPDGVE
jgi:hypothetical protein